MKTGECLLIGGPASLRVLEGNVEALGVDLKKGGRTVVRVFKALPVKAVEDSVLEIRHGVNGFVERIEEPYPPSWTQAVERALEVKGLVMVMGGVDTGKSTLCTLITNRSLLKGFKVAVMEADVGQAEIGPPTTVSLAVPRRAAPDLFRQSPVFSEFVGSTSPMGFVDEVVEAAARLKAKAELLNVELIVVNTDGWMDCGEAVRYKTKLAEALKPSLIILLRKGGELGELENSLSQRFTVLIVPPLSKARRRSREARRELRELSYQKNLRGSSLRSIPVSWVRILNYDLGTGIVLSEERFKQLNEQLNSGLVYGEETPNGLLLVLNRRLVSEDVVKRVFENFSRPVNIVWKGSERGLIVGLYDRDGRFLSIGVLEEIDYRRRVLKVRTSCQQAVGFMKLGCVRLMESWKEVEKLSRCPLKPRRV